MQKLDLSKIITPEEVYKIAKETKFIQRSGGKINPFVFLALYGFQVGRKY